MTKAKLDKIRGPLERGAFKVVLQEDIPADANCLPGRFVLALKSKEDGSVRFKARFVIGGHREKFKNFLVHHSITVQPPTILLLLTLAAAFDFDVWSCDVTQAYLQSGALERDVYIRNAAPEFELQPDEYLKFLKPSYGLCDAGDYWFAALDKHHREDLGMTQFKSDPTLYKLIVDGLLIGLSATYVDGKRKIPTDLQSHP